MSDITAKERSLQQEDRIAKMFGGNRTPRSGGGPWKLGDVLTDSGWLVECKTTVNPVLSYSVNKAILDKADHERASMNKDYYALAFTLGEEYNDYFVLDKRAMKSFIDLRNDVNSLKELISNQIVELDERYAKLKEDKEISLPEATALYQAHRAEKKFLLDELSKII